MVTEICDVAKVEVNGMVRAKDSSEEMQVGAKVSTGEKLMATDSDNHLMET